MSTKPERESYKVRGAGEEEKEHRLCRRDDVKNETLRRDNGSRGARPSERKTCLSAVVYGCGRISTPCLFRM